MYLNDAKLLDLMIHEPSAVPIFCHASLPLPVVAAAVWPNVEPVSRRWDCRHVTFTSTALTVTKPIQRQTLTSFELTGYYAGAQQGDYYECTASSSNRSYLDNFQLRVQRLDDLIRMTFEYQGGLTCTLTGVVEQYGSLHRIPLSPGAQYQCSNGLSTVANVYELKVTSLGIEGRVYAPSVNLGCKEVAKFSAVYLTDFAAQ